MLARAIPIFLARISFLSELRFSPCSLTVCSLVANNIPSKRSKGIYWKLVRVGYIDLLINHILAVLNLQFYFIYNFYMKLLMDARSMMASKNILS